MVIQPRKLLSLGAESPPGGEAVERLIPAEPEQFLE